MRPNEYQYLASRTECDQEAAASRYNTPGLLATRLVHAALGLSGESGELAYAVEKWIHYGQGLDATNIEEELGDCLWYIALACNALGISLEDVMEANILKLRTRYPDKYADDLAKEENRDREAEKMVVEGTITVGARQLRCEDDGVLYDEVDNSISKDIRCISTLEYAQYEPEGEPREVLVENIKQLELKARRIAKGQFICDRCGGPLSDEVVRKLHSPKHRTDIFHCPNCKHILIAQDIISISGDVLRDKVDNAQGQ